jgi:dienelactone hydrolase
MQRKYVLIITLLTLFLIAPVHAQATGIQFPDLTGPYQVGRTEFDLVDTARPETFTADANDRREIMVRVYYPAVPMPDATPTPYLTPDQAAAIAPAVGVEAAFYDQLHTHAYAAAPVDTTTASYPVIIFSPGFGTQPEFYSATLEDLASHGYIVVSLSHPYSTGVTVFPDGRVVTANAAGSDLSTSTSFEAIGKVWVGDVIFTLNQLETLNTNDPLLAGHLDLTHIGVYGHSFGGATAAEASYEDARLLASINMDGRGFGDVIKNGLAKPFMMMLADGVIPTDAELTQQNMTRADYDAVQTAMLTEQTTLFDVASPGYRFALVGSEHNTYATDYMVVAEQFPTLIPAQISGTVDGKQAVTSINAYIIGFFDKHLKGATVPLLDAPSTDYPDVDFQVMTP